MGAAILGFLTSLPQMLTLAQNIWAYLQHVSGNDPAGFLDRVNTAFTLLHKATTEQEYIDAARAIQDAIRRKP